MYYISLMEFDVLVQTMDGIQLCPRSASLYRARTVRKSFTLPSVPPPRRRPSCKKNKLGTLTKRCFQDSRCIKLCLLVWGKVVMESRVLSLAFVCGSVVSLFYLLSSCKCSCQYQAKCGLKNGWLKLMYSLWNIVVSVKDQINFYPKHCQNG